MDFSFLMQSPSRPISPSAFYTTIPSTSRVNGPVSEPTRVSAIDNLEDNLDGSATFRRCKALCGEVKARRPYARQGNVGEAWNEVLVALQEGGFYQGRKTALPTLRDELKELIAFKELMTFEEVSDLLGEPKKSGKIAKRLHKVRRFPFSREMFKLADTIAANLEFIQDDIRRINDERERERDEREKNRDNERDRAILLRQSALMNRVYTPALDESMALNDGGTELAAADPQRKRKSRQDRVSSNLPQKIRRIDNGSVAFTEPNPIFSQNPSNHLTVPIPTAGPISVAPYTRPQVATTQLSGLYADLTREQYQREQEFRDSYRSDMRELKEILKEMINVLSDIRHLTQQSQGPGLNGAQT